MRLNTTVILILALWLPFIPITPLYAQGEFETTNTDNSLVDTDGHEEEPDIFDPTEYTEEYLAENADRELIQPDVNKLILLSGDGAIKLSPQDANAVRDLRVDVRVTDYLINLVTPAELGGAGFSHIKVQRILKNYDTDGIGKYDRESLDALKEDNKLTSTHNDGKAVDISEIGDITCKLVERRHLGGSTTKWQSPRPIKVAWQSKDGIARFPTPKGPSLVELAGSMSAASILQMLNESGELDEYADFIKGLDLKSAFTYIGANVLLKNLGAKKITGDPLADDILKIIGSYVLVENFPGLPTGIVAANNDEDLRVATAKEFIAESLNLPAGSLRGKGWNEIIESVGKRYLENALGLPALYFESHPLDKEKLPDTALAVLSYLNRDDAAFNLFVGTVEKIKQGDKHGLALAGASVLAAVLRLTPSQRDAVEEAVRNKRLPQIDPTTFAIDKNLPLVTIAKLLTNNTDDQKQAEKELKRFGLDLLRKSLKNVVPSKYSGITNELFDLIFDENEDVILGDVKENLGTLKLADAADVEIREKDANSAKKRILNRLKRPLKDYLNEEFDLAGENSITEADIDKVLDGNGRAIVEKIGGSQIDKALSLNPGSGFAVISGKKSLEEMAEEIFARSVALILGIKGDRSISLKGDLHLNYGAAFVEDRLGLKEGDLIEKGSSSNFSLEERQRYFGKDAKERSLIDVRLGLPAGTIDDYYNGVIDSRELAYRAGRGGLSRVAIDQIWNYFDLSETLRLNKDEATLIIDVLKDWDNAGPERKDAFFKLIPKLVGRVFDDRAGFAANAFYTIFIGKADEKTTQELLNQGIRLLARAIGINLEKFDEKRLNELTDQIKRIFNGDTSAQTVESLINTLLEATDVPREYREDLMSFVQGDFRLVLERWSSMIWVKFAEEYLPKEQRLTYEEVKDSLVFDDAEAINRRALELYNKQTGLNLTYEQFIGLPQEQRAGYNAQARRLLMQEARDSVQYKISDAFIIKSLADTDITIPPDFTKTMMTGSDKERAALLEKMIFTNLDKALLKLDSSYEPGFLEEVYRNKGRLTKEQQDKLILSLIDRANINIGPFDTEFVKSFYLFIRAQDRTSFYTDPNYASMWNYLDSWLARHTGITGLPAGITKSIYWASQNNWDFNARLTQGDTVIIQSLSDIGQSFLIDQITRWADKALGLPAGSTFQIYQAVTKVIQASRALAAARAAAPAVNAIVTGLGGAPGAGDAAVRAAQANLSQAQAELTALAITIALNACSACQRLFNSIDQAIAAPPGFTNMAISGAIAAALGLGPWGLVAAAIYYLFGVYKVDFLCPVPPPDRFALNEFDNGFDKLEYKWGDYYDNPTRPVKASPKRGTEFFGKFGENPFDWDDDMKFVDGNNPELWMAWSRHFTGKFLDATLAYSAAVDDTNKARQIITYRRANVEFFAPRSVQSFGEIERNNPRVGMGYSQGSTKTTDWVHIGFGGIF